MLVFHNLDFTANCIQLMAAKTGTPQRSKVIQQQSRGTPSLYEWPQQVFDPARQSHRITSVLQTSASEFTLGAESTATLRRKTRGGQLHAAATSSSRELVTLMPQATAVPFWAIISRSGPLVAVTPNQQWAVRQYVRGPVAVERQ